MIGELQDFSSLRIPSESNNPVKQHDIDREMITNAILETTTSGILVISNDMKILFFNDQIARILNLPVKLTLNSNVSDIFKYMLTQIVYSEETINSIKKALKSECRYLFYIPLKNEKEIEVTIDLFIDDGIVHGKIIILRDVTDRLKVLQLEERIKIKQELLTKSQEYDELKTKFLRTVSHEFRTPLTVILGAVQLLMSYHNDDVHSVASKKFKRNLSIIRKNCYRMIKLTNNLIDITKIESGYMDLVLKNQNIVSLIEDITLSVVDHANKKGISVVFDTNVEEKIIGCDSGLLERVMLNLLSNAIKFTDYDGNIQVDLIDNEDTVIIKVRDNGIGIPVEKIDIIFDRFGQVDSSLNRQQEGSGIGLAIAKSLIEKHGGRIYLNDEFKEGSEFIIELPAVLADDHDNMNTHVKSNIDRLDIEFSDIYELNL